MNIISDTPCYIKQGGKRFVNDRQIPNCMRANRDSRVKKAEVLVNRATSHASTVIKHNEPTPEQLYQMDSRTLNNSLMHALLTNKIMVVYPTR